MTDTAIQDVEIAELEPEIEVTPEAKLPAFNEGVVAHKLPALSDRQSAFLPVSVADIDAVAGMLETLPGTRPEFKKPGACRAIVLQAALWRVSPLFVLQGAYQVKDGAPIGYEAKLIHAVILANAPLSRRPRLQYGYGGDGKRTAGNRFVKATAWVIGEDQPFSITTPTVSQFRVRNSPLWVSDPDQQLGYAAFRSLARLYFPDVLGGAYTREEVQQLRDLDALENARARVLFEEDEPVQAEFEDNIPPNEADAKSFDNFERRANGVQDSRDPRDAPQNRPQQQKDLTLPPQGAQEPDDLSACREWAATEQARILALPTGAEMASTWSAMIADKQWGRLKAYAQPVANAIKGSVAAAIEAKKGEKQ